MCEKRIKIVTGVKWGLDEINWEIKIVLKFLAELIEEWEWWDKMSGKILPFTPSALSFKPHFVQIYKACKDFHGSFLYNTAFSVGKSKFTSLYK